MYKVWSELFQEPWSSPAAKVLSPSTSKGPVPMTKNKIIEKKRSSKISSIVSAAGLVLSRGQRKRMAKKTNIVRRKEIGELVTAKQIKFEHGTLGEMDEIRLALPTAAPESKRGPGKQTKKKLQRTLIAETAQLRAVLTHPLFQARFVCVCVCVCVRVRVC